MDSQNIKNVTAILYKMHLSQFTQNAFVTSILRKSICLKNREKS